jgi:hypothetical protein
MTSAVRTISQGGIGATGRGLQMTLTDSFQVSFL